MIRTKRVYAPPGPTDGTRVLVDRLWPRGLSKSEAKVDRWEPDLAPSAELRRWFGHDPVKFAEFRVRYRRELAAAPGRVEALRQEARRGVVTLLFGARDAAHSNAAVLAELVQEERENERNAVPVGPQRSPSRPRRARVPGAPRS